MTSACRCACLSSCSGCPSTLLLALVTLNFRTVFAGLGSASPACSEELDVLILGAGIAGVKAAATLFDAGVQNFAVLEQSQRIGGRMWNTDWQGRTIELGANWIEGIPQDENPIWAIAQEIGLRGNYTMQEGSPVEPTLYGSSGRVHKEEAASLHKRLADALNGAMNISCDQHRRGLGDITLREAMLRAGWPPVDQQTPLERTLEFFVVDWDFEYPPDNVSLFNYFDVGKAGSWREACRKGGRRKHTRRAHAAARMGMLDGFSWEAPRYFVTDARGYAAVAEHIANRSFLAPSTSAGLRAHGGGKACRTPKLLLNKTVIAIRYGSAVPGGVRVETADGQVYSAKRCIVTFSSGVVNAAIRDGRLFYPALPAWKAHAFAKTDPGVYTKIFLRYSTRFWDDADYILFADPAKRGYYAVWQDMESHGKFFPNKSNILMVTLVQQDSQRVESQSRAETVAEVQAAMMRMYGPVVPEPIDILIPRWHSNEFFRGSWSNIAIGTTSLDFDAMQRPVGNVYFAGEATDADYNGFVLGGYHSGEAVSKRVLKDIKFDNSRLGLGLSALDAARAYSTQASWCGSHSDFRVLSSIAVVVIIGLSLLVCCFGLPFQLRLPRGHAKDWKGVSTPMLSEFRASCGPFKG